MTRSWSVHGFAHQGACLFVGDTLASPSSLFQIDHHADHAQPESGARFGNLTHGAFSSAVSGNIRILEEIRQFGTISPQCTSETESLWRSMMANGMAFMKTRYHANA